MTRVVHCVADDFRPVVASERARGNRGGRWLVSPQSGSSAAMRFPLDLDAIRAEFDLPDCVRLLTWPDGGTSIGCELTRCVLSGEPGRRGWWARRAQQRWWARFETRGRPRVVFAARPDEED